MILISISIYLCQTHVLDGALNFRVSLSKGIYYKWRWERRRLCTNVKILKSKKLLKAYRSSERRSRGKTKRSESHKDRLNWNRMQWIGMETKWNKCWTETEWHIVNYTNISLMHLILNEYDKRKGDNDDDDNDDCDDDVDDDWWQKTNNNNSMRILTTKFVHDGDERWDRLVNKNVNLMLAFDSILHTNWCNFRLKWCLCRHTSTCIRLMANPR